MIGTDVHVQHMQHMQHVENEHDFGFEHDLKLWYTECVLSCCAREEVDDEE